MFARIVGVVAVGLIAIFALEFFFFRRVKNRPSIFWEIAPVIGFVGAVMLVLAFAEAVRSAMLAVWQWGLGFGVGLFLLAAVMWWLSASVRRGEKETGWRAWIRIAQTYGIVLLFGVLGIAIAVRVVGALLQVFIASALGVLAISAAVAILAGHWRKSVNSKP